MARKKKREKKDLRRLKKQKLQKLRDLIGKDDQAFIKAHLRLYPKSELSPCKEAFYEAVHREAIKALSLGHWQEAKDLTCSLPARHPLTLLTEAISFLLKARTKEAHMCLEDLAEMDGAGDFLPLIADLNGLTGPENPDLERLNASICRALLGQNPRPRMSSQAAKDVWRLFRLLYRPERDGYTLPRTYWRELGYCISDLKNRGIQTTFLDQADRIVQIQKDVTSCLSANLDENEETLSCWAGDIRRLLIDEGDPLPKSLEHLAQCVRLTCYRLLRRPEGTVLCKDFGDILIRLLDVDEAKRSDLQEVMARWSRWQSMVRGRDFNGMRRMLLQYRDSKAPTPQERFLADIGLYSLAGQDESDVDPFSEFLDDKNPDTKRAMGLDALEDAATAIADLPDRDRREAAQVVQTSLNAMGEVPARQIRRQGEIWLTLSEYLPKDGGLLLAAYAALRLSNSLNVLARRTRETLIAKKGILSYNTMQEPLLTLFYSTMEMRYSRAWKEIIAFTMELLPGQWPEVEQKLVFRILEEWRKINKIAGDPLVSFFSGFSDFGINSKMAKETSQRTDRILEFGHRVFGNNPEILALEVLNILINTPAKKRLSCLNQRFNKASLSVKWRIAVYLGTLDMVGIERTSRLDLACHALSRILPGIPHDFGHWEEIVSCVDHMEESILWGGKRQYRSLRQLLLKKLRDVQARLNSAEEQAVITEYIDRIR